MFILQATARTAGETPKRLRREGSVPGVLYGKSLDESVSVTLTQKETAALLKSNAPGSTVRVQMENNAYPTLLREVATKPGTGELLHLSFQVLVADEAVTSAATVVLLNRELSTGIVQQPLSEIAFKALPADLFDRVEIDIAGMGPGDTVRVADLPVFQNPNVEILTAEDGVLVSISEVRAVVDEETEGDADSAADDQDESEAE